MLYHGQLQALNGIIGEDPELYTACMDAYNEWLSEYTAPARSGLIGVAMLPAFLNPAGAAIRCRSSRSSAFGSSDAVLSERRPLQQPGDGSALERDRESGIPLSFHVTAFQEFHGYGSLGANVARNLSPFRPLLGQLIFSGVFERHPDLKVVFAEGGAAWVADSLYSMDKIYRAYYTILRPQLPHLPSFYWKRQCYRDFHGRPDRHAVDRSHRRGERHVVARFPASGKRVRVRRQHRQEHLRHNRS